MTDSKAAGEIADKLTAAEAALLLDVVKPGEGNGWMGICKQDWVDRGLAHHVHLEPVGDIPLGLTLITPLGLAVADILKEKAK